MQSIDFIILPTLWFKTPLYIPTVAFSWLGSLFNLCLSSRKITRIPAEHLLLDLQDGLFSHFSTSKRSFAKVPLVRNQKRKSNMLKIMQGRQRGKTADENACLANYVHMYNGQKIVSEKEKKTPSGREGEYKPITCDIWSRSPSCDILWPMLGDWSFFSSKGSQFGSSPSRIYCTTAHALPELGEKINHCGWHDALSLLYHLCRGCSPDAGAVPGFSTWLNQG